MVNSYKESKETAIIMPQAVNTNEYLSSHYTELITPVNSFNLTTNKTSEDEEAILEEDLESQFALPKISLVTSDGQVHLKFSNQIKTLRFSQLGAKFLSPSQ